MRGTRTREATMAVEQTLVIIKPDGMARDLVGDVLSRLSASGLRMTAAKMVRVSRELAERHYEALREKPFFGELVAYLTGELHGVAAVLALVYEGEDAVRRMREVVGATNPEQAAPGTVRGSYGRITTKGVFENVVHASSSVEDAEKEIKLWFRPDEVVGVGYPSKEVEGKVRVWA